MSVYLSFGRNVGAQPMPPEQWRDFVAMARIVVAAFAGPVVSVVEGDGWYEGMPETTCIVVGAGQASADLRESVADLARLFGQECIALAEATPEFIAARQEAAA